jgi:hypothetical protein
MSNRYAENLKNEIKDFYQKVKQAKQEMLNNSSRYLPETAETENTRVWAGVENEYTKVRNAVLEEFEGIKEALSLSCTLTAEYQSSEIEFFNGSVPKALSPIDYEIFSDMHKTNYWWQQFLLDQINKLSDAEQEEFATVRIQIEMRTAESILDLYVKMYQSALGLLDKVFNNSASPVLELDIEYFLTENKGFTSDFFELLGDGSEIAMYTKTALKLPESAKRRFDSVQLVGSSIGRFKMIS